MRVMTARRSCLLFAAALAACAGSPLRAADSGPRPELIFRADFEGDATPGLKLAGGTITHDPADVIAGAASCRADSRGVAADTTLVLETIPDVRLPPGHAYRVRLRYRILDPVGTSGRLVLDLHSDTTGKTFAGPSIVRERGAQGTLDGLFEILDTEDFRLRVRLARKMAVVVDDVEIRRCAGAAPGDGAPIRTLHPAQDPLLAQIEAAPAARNPALLWDMLNVIVNAGNGIRFWPYRDRIAEELRIDWAQWNPLVRKRTDEIARRLGVRTATSHAEYQALVHPERESDDVWNRRFELFYDDGFIRTYENTIYIEDFIDTGAHTTCHNGSRWHEWIARELDTTLDTYEGICQDNIGCAPFLMPWGSRGCFCPGCEKGFRGHLRERYSAAELAAWGIADLPTFSFRERFLDVGCQREAALRDPVAREWIKYQYRTHRDLWADLVLRAKRRGAREGRFVSVGGNQFGGNGSWPFALLLSPYNDFIEIEDVHEGAGGRVEDRSFVYKIGLASGRHEKPVWVRDGPDPAYAPAWKVAFGEALANGGVRDLNFNEPTFYIEPVEQDKWPAADGRKTYEVYKAYARMADENRAAFTPTKSEARAAVVYSFPSMMWSHFPPYQLDAGHAFDALPFGSRDLLKPGARPFQRIVGACAFLDERHMQHDVVMFGHDELWRDADVLAGLGRYRVLVLPYAPCLSDAQAAALREFVAKGGRIIRIGEVGTRDEDWNPRARAALEGVPMPDLLAEPDAALAELVGTTDLVTDAPADTRVNLRKIMDGRCIAVHVLRYDVEGASPARPVRVEFPLAGLAIDAAIRITLDGRGERVPYEIVDGRVRFTAPAPDPWEVIVLAKAEEFEKANAAARERRERDRQQVREERERR